MAHGKRTRPRDVLDRQWRLRKLPGETQADLVRRYMSEAPTHDARVIGLLLKRYQIVPNDPQCWCKLAFALANQYVPAMSASLLGRRPTTADVKRFRRVVALVAKGKTERQACYIATNGDEKGADALRQAFRRWNKIRR
jgi:hypothetical protein